MKHTTKSIVLGLCGAVALTAALPAAAQQDVLRSGYFLEGYVNRHELNPAFAPERNYFTIPVLGGFNESLNANVGLNAFLYPMTNSAGQEQLTTFMNPGIDAASALSRFKATTKLTEGFTLPIFNYGWEAWGGYNTVGLSAVATAGVSMPKDLFTFMKLGMTGESNQYDFSNLNVRANSYVQLALGHSRQINEQLRLGAKLKFMLGALNAYASVDRFDATLTQDVWTINATGAMHVAGGSGLYIPRKAQTHENISPESANLIDFDEIEYNNFGFSGFGMGVDLGAVYQLTPSLEISASLLDLGFISWNKVYNGYTPDKTWTFDGFHSVALDSDADNYEQNKLSQQFKDLGDQLQDCLEYRLDEKQGSRCTGIGATLHIGAQYTMPFYQPLRGGFLFTQRINGPFSWTEGRFSANVAPVKWFDASLNYGVSSYGSSLGWIANFHPKGCNVFVGVDYQFWKVSPQMIPVGRANLCASFGINITLGSERSHKLNPLLDDDFKPLAQAAD